MIPAHFMSPADFTRQYHQLNVHDPFFGFFRSAEVTEYGTGWGWHKDTKTGKWTKDGNRPGDPGPTDLGKAIQEEHRLFRNAVRMLHHGDLKECPKPFFFARVQSAVKQPTARNSRTGIGQSKNPHRKSLLPLPPYMPRHSYIESSVMWVFNGKGSPAEIEDVLELALATGRIANGANGRQKDAAGVEAAKRDKNRFCTLEDYCKKFITLDCLTLTAHYYGLDRNTDKPKYVSEIRARKNIGDIQPKDLLVSIDKAGKLVHFAIVHNLELAPGASPNSNQRDIQIAEWGNKGPPDAHIKPKATATINKQGTWKQYGVCFPGTKGERYFFAPPPPDKKE